MEFLLVPLPPILEVRYVNKWVENFIFQLLTFRLAPLHFAFATFLISLFDLLPRPTVTGCPSIFWHISYQKASFHLESTKTCPDTCLPTMNVMLFFFSNCNPISTFVVKAVVTFISKCIALYITNNSKSLKYNVQYKFIPLGFFCTHIFSENRTPDEFLVNFDIFTKIEGTKKSFGLRNSLGHESLVENE